MNESTPQPAPATPDPAAGGELVAHALGGARAQLPLDEVLLALADDAGDRRLRRGAHRLADELRRGADLAAAFRAIQTDLPRYLRRAFAASEDDAQMIAMIEGLIEHETTRQRLRRQMQSVLLYPAVVFALLCAVLAGASLFVVPQFISLLRNFDIQVPATTSVLLSLSRVLPWMAVAFLAVPMLYWAAALTPWGRRFVHWLRTGVPFLGRLWIWHGQHEFASVLGALTARRVVLHDALRCTVASLRDRNLARAARIAADKCERGATLSRSLAESLHFDSTMAALVAWGESHASLPQSLDEAARVFEQAIDLQAAFLRRVLPPVLFIVVVSSIFLFVCGLMIPLIELINGLSF